MARSGVQLPLLLLLCSCCLRTSGDACAGGFLTAGHHSTGPEEDLKPEIFVKCVKDSKVPHLIEYHSGFCDTCKAFQKIWFSLTALLSEAKDVSLKLDFGRIDVDKDGGADLAQAEDALQGGLPSIVLYMGRGRAGELLWHSDGEENFPTAAALRRKVTAAYLDLDGSRLRAQSPPLEDVYRASLQEPVDGKPSDTVAEAIATEEPSSSSILSRCINFMVVVFVAILLYLSTRRRKSWLK